MNSDKIHKIFLGITGIIIIYLLVVIYIFYFLPTKSTQSESGKSTNNNSINNTDKNKHTINTKLDLANIFVYNDINYSEDGQSITTSAIFNDNKIYFAFVPTNCDGGLITKSQLKQAMSICEWEAKEVCSDKNSEDYKDYIEQDKNLCEDDYCEKKIMHENENYLEYKQDNKISLCKFLNVSKKSDFDEKNVRYVITANIDGSNMKKLKTYESSRTELSFDYLTKDSLFYVDMLSGSNKIDLKNNKINNFSKNNIIIGTKPFSDEKRVAIAESDFNNTDFKIDYYNIDTLNIEDSKTIPVSDRIRLDKYNDNDYYTYNSDTNKLYKNGEIIYDVSSLINFGHVEYFSTKSYIYIIYSNHSDNYYIAKIDKEGYQLINKTELVGDYKSDINYLLTNTENEVFLADSNKIYKFNEDNMQLEEISELTNGSTIINSKGYNDYIIYEEEAPFYDLVLYNTVTKEKKTLGENVKYYYLNKLENRIYLVERNKQTLKLSYYEI